MSWAAVRSDYPTPQPERQPKDAGGAVILLPKLKDYNRALAMWDPAAPIVYILHSDLAQAVPMGVPTPMRHTKEWQGWTVLVGQGVRYSPGPWEDRSSE